MSMDLPLYMLDISDDFNDDAEVNFVSLVDRPAVKKNWNAFKTIQKFQVISEEKRIICGVVMLADTPIFRSDYEMGDYYVAFSKETIFKIAQRFFAKGYQNNVNLMHDSGQIVDGVTMFESFISDKDRGILPMKGFEDAPDGSWFGSFKVNNDDVWKRVLSGEILGFSVEGIFNYKPIQVSKEDMLMAEICKILDSVNMWDEGNVERDSGGRFAPKGGGSDSSNTEPAPVSQLKPQESPDSNVASSHEELKKIYENKAPEAAKMLIEIPELDTQKLYLDKNGNYSNERANFQKGIINNFLNEGSTNFGTSYFLGGAPATGKSSIESSGMVKFPEGILRVDPDKIKEQLPEYNKMLQGKHYESAAKVHEESSKISKELVANAANRKMDVLVDAVGDGSYEKIVEKVNQQKEAGKNVVAHYVTTDLQTSLDRAQLRAEKSGRYVPPSYIKEMHKEISAVFPKLASNNVFHELHLYDNNGSSPKLIYSKVAGKETIHDSNAYKKFLDKSKG